VRIQVTAEARRDWRAILRYLQQKFGPATEQQAIILLQQLFANLLRNPGRGRPVKSEVYPDLRVCILKKSLVFYRVSEGVIRVVRIMDGRQDPRRWLAL
jgi:plasmid stabilization system protein ParE